MELHDGNYLARAVSASLGEAKTGTPCIGVQFRLSAPEYSGHAVTWYGYFTDKAQDRTIESLRICGWRGADLTDMSGLTDNDVELVIGSEEYQGKTYSKVQFVNRVGGLSLSAPMPEAKAKAFAAKMKGAILAFDQKAGAPKPKPAPKRSVNGEPPPHDDSDMPPF